MTVEQWEQLERIWVLNEKPLTKLVLISLLATPNVSGTIIFSRTEITERTGLSPATVSKALVDLESRGLLERVGQRGKKTIWRVTLAAGDAGEGAE